MNDNEILNDLNTKYKYIDLPNGEVLCIKFDDEGIVYDRWSKGMGNHLESYGYDFYEERNLTKTS